MTRLHRGIHDGSSREFPLVIDGLCSIISERGRGRRTIVLLASMLIRSRSYSRLVQRLAKSFHVVTIDPPGTGRASKLASPWQFEDYAQHLLRVLVRLDLGDVTLIGHSNSGAVAMLAASSDERGAQRIARVILVDSVGADPRHGFWRIGLGRVLDGVFEAGFSITALRDIFWNLFVHNQNFLAEIEQAITWDATPPAPRVRVPTLIAWGGHDLTFFPWCGQRLHAMIPHAAFRIFAPGHHDWLATNPDEFATTVENFMQRTPPAPQGNRN
jgi:pimeloyl-ACP methyl ester carboxylesterase